MYIVTSKQCINTFPPEFKRFFSPSRRISSHLWMKHLISGPVIMLYCQSICCFAMLRLLVGPHAVTWHTVGKPSLPHSNLSFCFVFWHTVQKQISEYTIPGKEPRTDTFTDILVCIHNIQTHIYPQKQMCILYSVTLSFLQSKLQRVTETEREMGREEGKDVFYDPSLNERSFRGLSLSARPELYTLT